MRQIPESQRDTPQMLQTTVDRFGGAIRATHVIEVGQYVIFASLQGGA